MTHIIYECEICGCYHPWDWNGDCRDDANRYGDPEEYAERNRFGSGAESLEVRSMDDRVAADDGMEVQS